MLDVHASFFFLSLVIIRILNTFLKGMLKVHFLTWKLSFVSVCILIDHESLVIVSAFTILGHLYLPLYFGSVR